MERKNAKLRTGWAVISAVAPMILLLLGVLWDCRTGDAVPVGWHPVNAMLRQALAEVSEGSAGAGGAAGAAGRGPPHIVHTKEPVLLTKQSGGKTGAPGDGAPANRESGPPASSSPDSVGTGGSSPPAANTGPANPESGHAGLTDPAPDNSHPGQATSTEPALAKSRTKGKSTAARTDLNTAGEAQLVALPGIGPVKAKAILAYRARAGGFQSVDELQRVKGIGPKTLARLRPLVTVTR